MTKNKTSLLSGSLVNKCLVSMPDMGDERFESTVIYICSHDEKKGAMGLVLNKPCMLSFSDVLSQLHISSKLDKNAFPKVLWGGPVEQIRGFILHSNDYTGFETEQITDSLSITASIDVLSEIAKGEGPKKYLLALGYSSWESGQLELEIAGNSWLVFDATEDFLFNCPVSQKWQKALSIIGINPLMLSLEQGSV
ncbi:MAG: YqgE/AlgH family protein [Alphaproteobacteria bacterium]|nr:YqgE/AlgH family protein [Alphaproteobacteria bacterium]